MRLRGNARGICGGRVDAVWVPDGRAQRGPIIATRLSQKGLDFGRDQSVTADDTRVLTSRDADALWHRNKRAAANGALQCCALIARFTAYRLLRRDSGTIGPSGTAMGGH